MRARALVTVGMLAVACGEATIVVGSDPAPTESAEVDNGGGGIIGPDAAPFDPTEPPEDAAPIKIPPRDSGTTDSGTRDVTCPTLSPPAPGFCDGATPLPKYDANGCIVGYGCGPLDCAAAGGQCVGLAPGSCPSNRYGDVAEYPCGGGIGTACCLP